MNDRPLDLGLGPDAARYVPLSDGMLVLPDEGSEFSPGGVALPSPEKKPCMRGRVLLMGPGFVEINGHLRVFQVPGPGTFVWYPTYCGHEVKLDGVTYRQVYERECVAWEGTE